MLTNTRFCLSPLPGRVRRHPIKCVMMFNYMQIIINIFSCILFVYFIHQIYVFKFTHKYTSVPPYFAPHRSKGAPNHTKSLIFIHNVAYFAQN